MDVQIHDSWKQHLHEEFQLPYFQSLTAFVKKEYESAICFPKGKDIFAAFDHCPFDSTKVVIIGQDPYHGPGQANGLAFSVLDGITHPPSLRNIFKEIESDLGTPYPESGNLERWASQGVLLLNATLTVQAHLAGSHQNKGWEKFTDKVITIISEKKENLVFLLWGGFAKSKARFVQGDTHQILTSGHPSPLSANRGYWFGNKHFSQTNEILKGNQEEPIKW